MTDAPLTDSQFVLSQLRKFISKLDVIEREFLDGRELVALGQMDSLRTSICYTAARVAHPQVQ